MPSHRIRDYRNDTEWVLEWNDLSFSLKSTDRRHALEVPTADAHRLIDIYELYVERRVSLETSEGPIKFRRQENLLLDIRHLFECGLLRDEQYRGFLKSASRKLITRGVCMFLLGAIPFGLYSWIALATKGISEEYRDVGWLIHLMLLACLAVALAGLGIGCFAIKQSWRLRRIEHQNGKPGKARQGLV